MPSIISFRIRNLVPNNRDANNANNQSAWFSYVRSVYSLEKHGTVIPPTKTEFMREWNKYDYDLLFRFSEDNLQNTQEFIKHNNYFDTFNIPNNVSQEKKYNKIKAITWTRMIIAFNFYSHACSISRPETIDFIGSTSGNNVIEKRFNGRNVLFITNMKLQEMIQIVEENRQEEFWQCIFDIYNSLRYRNNSVQYRENFIPNNQQLAEMIKTTTSPLPLEIKKTIYDICMAFHISSPVEM